MAEFTAEQRAALHALARDIAESEHRLRHPNAFLLACDVLGFVVEHGAARTTVRDPIAEAAAQDAGPDETADAE